MSGSTISVCSGTPEIRPAVAKAMAGKQDLPFGRLRDCVRIYRIISGTWDRLTMWDGEASGGGRGRAWRGCRRLR